MKTFIPPKYAQRNAQKALDCLDKGSKAMTKTGRNRAKQLALGKPLNKKDLQSISSFERHYKNAFYKGDICKDRGAVAWLGWGLGYNEKREPSLRFDNWVERKLGQM